LKSSRAGSYSQVLADLIRAGQEVVEAVGPVGGRLGPIDFDAALLEDDMHALKRHV
jgi:hypothetical protein